MPRRARLETMNPVLALNTIGEVYQVIGIKKGKIPVQLLAAS
jgi:hypothetical protein